MKNIGVKTIFLVFVVVFADCADASLYNDPRALAGYTGRTSIIVSQSAIELKVDVEYAVYTPGTYPGNDLTGRTEYVYAYQLFNNISANVTVDFFSVGINNSTLINLIYTDNTYGIANGVNPFVFHFPQSAGYVFIGNPLNPAQWSDVLIFSSTHSPTIGFGAVSGGGLCGMGSLPTPAILPEPATVVFIAPAIFILRSRNKK